MNTPTRNPMTEALRQQATAIYNTWSQGNISTAEAMLGQIPHKRTAYVTFTLAMLAVNEGLHSKYAMSRFIEGVTE